ncbi:hypothetical protein D9758_006573 [Tetrapyrgos nigripes]|uniref:Membrane insertase YidC/Oxa/ALB C-terminal domain-containing protein n=1 Tax=Tetrapyrgos nigripes TaxID=182062 RepID=A0A8H5LRI4_9AGAR|nr:hypothetical protein D9758_006573 [Tetrapyrgos nigripes]
MSLVGLRTACINSSSRRIGAKGVSIPRRFSGRTSSLLSTPCVRATPVTGLARSISLWPWSSRSLENKTSAQGDSLQETSLDNASAEIVSFPVDTATSPVASADVASSLPAGVDPAATVDLLPPSVVNETINNVANTIVDAANSIPPPLQYGDLAALGLAKWTPPGLIQWSLELINVSTGLPWFWTIVTGAAVWRIICIPAAIKTTRFASRVALIQPQLNALAEKVKEAQAKKDIMAMQQVNAERSKLFNSIGESAFGGLVGPLVQMPIAIGMFLGVRKICTLPVEQLHYSGIGWLPDLTIADPTGVLPVVLGACMFWQLTITASELDLVSRPTMAHVMNLLRFPGAPLTALYMSTMPCGLVLSLIVASVLTGMQTVILRAPAVRSYFRILPAPVPIGRQGLPSYKMTYRWIVDSYKERIAEAQARQNATRLNNRGPTRRL